ncbi:unnamed protein product [Urochloa humidicola]
MEEQGPRRIEPPWDLWSRIELRRPYRPHLRRIRQNRMGTRAGMARTTAWRCRVVQRSGGGELVRPCRRAGHAEVHHPF